MSPTLRSIRDEVQRLQDEIRPRVHLAGASARREWAALEPLLELFDRQAELSAGRTADDLVETGMGLGERLRHLRMQVRHDLAAPPTSSG